uniref:Uncharacterized protein n=1 Tax=Podoviridae sp. ctlpi2 TaxID=2826574 RepID=A0A8S5ML92_9CAUD|nr:MAG TPA: hypothetical protein [Podoviridae sp. ctlpi2]
MSLPITMNAPLPQVQLPADVLAKIAAQFATAAANVSASIPRLTFAGREFRLNENGTERALDSKLLDVHIVAVNPTHHYQFFEREYDETKDMPVGERGNMMSRLPLPSDEIEWTPTKEWAQRLYKQRVVLMLADDPQHRLWVADFGYKSVRKSGNPAIGLFNLGQLLVQFNEFQKTNPKLLPFLFTVQLSFTRESVPEVQFSLTDQRADANGVISKDVRFARQDAIEAIMAAISDGSAEKMLDVAYDSRTSNNAEPEGQAAAPTTATYAAVTQPATQQQAQASAPVQPAAQTAAVLDELGAL